VAWPRRSFANCAQADDPEITAAQQAAREAGARDFQRRVEEAISTVAELQKTRKPSSTPSYPIVDLAP